VVEGATRFYEYKGECPATEDLLGRVIVIPSHHHLREADRDRIVRHFNRALAGLQKRADT